MLVFPSPKFQLQLVGVLIELSMNVTVSGFVPDVGEPEKPATGATTPELTVM